MKACLVDTASPQQQALPSTTPREALRLTQCVLLLRKLSQNKTACRRPGLKTRILQAAPHSGETCSAP